MRSFICLFAVGLISAATAAPVFAGDKTDCDFLKDKESPYYQEFKGLFGLCVAYQNSDEDGREDIIRLWDKRVAEIDIPVDDLPEMPNREGDSVTLSCDCWDGLSSAEICAMGVAEPYVNPGYGGAVYFNDFDSEPQTAALFVSYDYSDYGTCKYTYYVQGSDPVTLGENQVLTPEQAIQCVTEIEAMAYPDFCP